MKRVLSLFAALLLAALPLFGAQAAVTFQPFELESAGITAAFPEGWTVVTPETTSANMKWFDEASAEIAANNMISEGCAAVAFSPDGKDTLRVFISEDADSALYWDISRYTQQMRTSIRADYLDRDAWALTGYRFTSAEWTNRGEQGYVLWMAFTMRYDDTIVARGLQAFTVRGGKRITVEFRTSEKVEDADNSMFRKCVGEFVFPQVAEEEMPLLPVGLTVTGGLPEETCKSTVTLRGTTTKKAIVSAMLIDQDGASVEGGSAAAGSDGAYKLTVTVPAEGEWQLLVTASLDGMADSALSSWLTYDADMLPVNFTSYLSGDVYDEKLVLSGKTIDGVKIQCIENDVNKTIRTDSAGNFSFTLDRGITGARKVVLQLSKKGFADRRFIIEFNRCWAEGEYGKYLENQVQSLSYENLSTKGDRYAGRIVKYSGVVQEVSSNGERYYVRFLRDGDEKMQLIAVQDGGEMPLAAGDSATIYFQVTGESYTFSTVTADGEAKDAALPSVTLLSWQRN